MIPGMWGEGLFCGLWGPGCGLVLGAVVWDVIFCGVVSDNKCVCDVTFGVCVIVCGLVCGITRDVWFGVWCICFFCFFFKKNNNVFYRVVCGVAHCVVHLCYVVWCWPDNIIV